MDLFEWFGTEANARILSILGQRPLHTSAIDGFARTAQTLVAWWDADDDRKESRRERNYDTESTVSKLLQDFLLRTTSTAAETILRPILEGVDRHPDKVYSLLIGLIIAEDNQPNTPQFWFVWDLFAARIRRATWLADIGHEYATGAQLVSAIFLATKWKEEVRHWKSVEGYSDRVHALFEDLPAVSEILDNYVRFLFHIGERSLPDAFTRIVRKLEAGDCGEMLKASNTVFMLEVLLQRFVYGRPMELKRHQPIRDAVLSLLDILVEAGSSAAFRMRDDFVTPASTA